MGSVSEDLILSGTFPIFIWSFGASAILLTAGRLYIRLRELKSLKWDDLFNVLALGSLIGFYATFEIDETAYDLVLSLRMELAANMLAWITLYLVKAAFLAFIISIFSISDNFRKAWWALTIYTFVTFWPIVLTELWKCGTLSNYDNPISCLSTPAWFQLQIVFASCRAAFHISSDILILALPIIRVRKMHMSKAKKISVAAIFALVIIDIIGGIIKSAAIICTFSQEIDVCPDMANVWTVCEPGIAVIVCNLPVYRTLLSSCQKCRKEDLEQQQLAAVAGNERPRNASLTDNLLQSTGAASFGEEWVRTELLRLSQEIGQKLKIEQVA